MLCCDVSVCAPNQSVRYSQGKVGVCRGNQNFYLVVIRLNQSEKFLISETNVKLHKLTFEFKQPNKYVMLKNFDQKRFEVLIKLMKRILTNPDQVPPLKPLHVMLKNVVDNKVTKYKSDGFRCDAKKLLNKDLCSLQLFDFTKLPVEVWKPKCLTTLILSNCNLKSIKYCLKDFRHTLVYLKLNDNKINEIPPWFCTQMQNLVTLDFSRNRLRRIPFELNSIKTLKSIDFSHNQISRLPLSMICNMFKFNEVNLSYNHISYLQSNKQTSKINANLAVNLSENRFLNPSEPSKKATDSAVDTLFDLCMKHCISNVKLINQILKCDKVSKPIYDYFQDNVFVCSKCNKFRINHCYHTFNTVKNFKHFHFLIEDFPPVTEVKELSYYCQTCA